MNVTVMGYTMTQTLLTLKLFKSDEATYNKMLATVLAIEAQRGFKYKKINKPTAKGTNIKFVPIEDQQDLEAVEADLMERLGIDPDDIEKDTKGDASYAT